MFDSELLHIEIWLTDQNSNPLEIIPNTVAAGAAVNNTNKKVIFKNCALFTDCITAI